MRIYCLFLLFSILLLSQCDQPTEPADLIIISDQIYTGTGHTANFIAIKDGRIIEVGEQKNMKSLQDPTTKVIHADSAFVIPGLIEGHGHFGGLGSSLMNLNFLRSKSWDEIVAAVADEVKKKDDGEWIIGRGWHQEKWNEPVHDHVHNYPKHLDLSEISPNNPVMLIHASGHGLFANKKAMDMAGVNKETPNPSGGEIVRDESGEAIGVFEERAMSAIYGIYHDYLDGLSEDQKLEQWREGIELAQEKCLKNGITTFQDAGSSFDEILRYQEMAKKGELDVRLWAMLRHSSEKLKRDLSPYIAVGLGDHYFTCKAIKSELDGALGAFGAWLTEPYSDKQDFYGQNTTTLDEVKAIADIAYANDMQLCVHAIGDRANHETLNIFEDYANQDTTRDLRWRVEHSQHLLKSDIPRFSKIGAIASMQAIHCTSDAPFVEKRLGYQRSKEGAYNWRGLLDHGAVVTNGTDTPVEDIDPIASFYASVTRRRPDTGLEFFPENKMTREEAIKSYTISCAYAAFEEDLKGTIEKGKLADITILSKNWLTCTDEEILDTEVLYTIIDGKIMYQKAE